jgi:general secretion pathway protein M
MTARLAPWWEARSRREQRLLMLMAALFLILGAWLLIFRPLDAALDSAKLRHAAAVEAAAEARARRPAATRPGARVPLPVDSMVRRSAQEAGFGAARIAAQGPRRADVAIDAARAPALFSWIAAVEGAGVKVERLQARRNADQTLRVEIRFGA